MREKIASLCLGAGLGLAGPALFCRAVSLGSGPSEAAALFAAGAAALWALAPQAASARSALAAAGAAWLSTAFFLPLLGLQPAFVAAIPLTAAGLALGAGGRRPSLQVPAWVAALAGAAAVAWVRLLSLLSGDSLWSFTLVLAGAACGAAAGAGLRRWRLDETDAGLWCLGSGLAGLLGLGLLRFVGLNTGSAELLQKPAAGRDFLLLASHAGTAVFLWSAAAGAAATTPGSRLGRALSAAGPLAAAWLTGRLGSAQASAAMHGLMLLAAVAVLGPRRLSPRSMLGQATAAALAAALWLALLSRGLLPDVWLNRLNAVFPGGRYLALSDDGRESLGLYRFSSGATVLLREGAAWSNPKALARRQAHLALLAHPAPKSALLAVLSPASARSALTHGVETTWTGSAASVPLMRAMDEPAWPPVGLKIMEGGFRDALKRPGPGYDVILLELPVLPGRPSFPTRETFAAAKTRLAPGGVLAVRIPTPRTDQLPRLLATAAAFFPHSGAFELPGGPLLVFSQQAVVLDPDVLRARLTLQARLDDIDLLAQLPALSWLGPERLPSPQGPPLTDEKP